MIKKVFLGISLFLFTHNFISHAKTEAAGVVFYTRDKKGDLYFLLGQEFGTRVRYSDFGGDYDNKYDKNDLENTGAREASEELMLYFDTKASIQDLVNEAKAKGNKIFPFEKSNTFNTILDQIKKVDSYNFYNEKSDPNKNYMQFFVAWPLDLSQYFLSQGGLNNKNFNQNFVDHQEEFFDVISNSYNITLNRNNPRNRQTPRLYWSFIEVKNLTWFPAEILLNEINKTTPGKVIGRDVTITYNGTSYTIRRYVLNSIKFANESEKLDPLLKPTAKPTKPTKAKPTTEWDPNVKPAWEWSEEKANSAGILPYTFSEDGTAYFLLTKQKRPTRLSQIKNTKNQWEKAFGMSINDDVNQLVWSDFGDQSIENESEPEQTAARALTKQSNAFPWRLIDGNFNPLLSWITMNSNEYIKDLITGLSQQMGRNNRIPKQPPAYWMYFAEFEKKYDLKKFDKELKRANLNRPEMKWIKVEDLLYKVQNEKDFYGVVYPFDDDKTALYVGTLEKLRQPDSKAFIADKLKVKPPYKKSMPIQPKKPTKPTPPKDPLENALKTLLMQLQNLQAAL